MNRESVNSLLEETAEKSVRVLEQAENFVLENPEIVTAVAGGLIAGLIGAKVKPFGPFSKLTNELTDFFRKVPSDKKLAYWALFIPAARLAYRERHPVQAALMYAGQTAYMLYKSSRVRKLEAENQRLKNLLT